MKCDIVQNRLLALTAADAVPADLGAHLDECDLCRRYRDRAALLTAELAVLPTPSSEDAKAAYLDSLLAAGPVIKSVPSIPSYAGGWSWKYGWKPVGGLAAAVAVGVGIWAANRPATTIVAPDVAAGPRHELLEKVVALDTQLAKARTPEERIPLLAKMAEALKTETAGVYKAAKPRDDEVRSLAGKFEKVVTEGIVKQAAKLREDKFAPVAERHKILAAAADALAHSGDEADRMATTAPPQVKGSLEQMAKAAKAGWAELERLRRDA
jgi:hypothetical protein